MNVTTSTNITIQQLPQQRAIIGVGQGLVTYNSRADIPDHMQMWQGSRCAKLAEERRQQSIGTAAHGGNLVIHYHIELQQNGGNLRRIEQKREGTSSYGGGERAANASRSDHTIASPFCRSSKRSARGEVFGVCRSRVCQYPNERIIRQ